MCDITNCEDVRTHVSQSTPTAMVARYVGSDMDRCHEPLTMSYLPISILPSALRCTNSLRVPGRELDKLHANRTKR